MRDLLVVYLICKYINLFCTIRLIYSGIKYKAMDNKIPSLIRMYILKMFPGKYVTGHNIFARD